jgi:phospholipid transport system substrate-binding protein
MYPRVIILAALVGCFLVGPAAGEAKYQDSGVFVSSLGNRAIELLTSKETSEEEQERHFRTLLREGFAVKKIGKFVLGRYRRQASSEQIEEFLGLFEDYIVSLYSSAFRNYSGETFKVKRVVKTRSARDTMVVTYIYPSSNSSGVTPTKIVFQVHNSQNEYKVLDVKIQGVSMIITQRDEFTGFIRNNGGEVGNLIDALRKKMDSLKNKAADS